VTSSANGMEAGLSEWPAHFVSVVWGDRAGEMMAPSRSRGPGGIQARARKEKEDTEKVPPLPNRSILF
jgi:hypothetical protein